MVQSKILVLLIIVGAIINPLAIHAEHPYTGPVYVTSEKVGDIIQLNETNDDDKSNLEPIPLIESVVAEFAGGPTNRYIGNGIGFSTQGDNDYFLLQPQPQITSDIKRAYITVYFYIYFYTANPQNGTWTHLSLETINGTVERQILVEVASDPHVEILGGVSQYNSTGLTDTQISGPEYGRNLYAIWGNNNMQATVSPKAYKNESGVISLATGRSTKPNFFNGSNKNLTDTFVWRAAKFYISDSFPVSVLPMEAYLSDVVLKISSPLNLTFSYEFRYELFAEPTNARLDFPIHYFLLAFIPFVLVVLKRKSKKISP